MTGFRNIFYNSKLESIHLWGWDSSGKRIESVTSFEPYLYIETKTTHPDGKSIFNTDLKKITFENNFKKKQFLETNPIKRVFGNLPPEQQFLLDSYKDGIHDEYPLKTIYLDIETYATDRKFSSPEEATDPINLITIYDSLSQKFYTWGLKNSYKSDLSEVIYMKCKTEEDLLENFLKFWENDYPDIVTGWNSAGYDIPYIINRIKRIIGNEEADRLSPVRKIWLRPNASVNFKGQKQDRWIIYGVTHLDYMDVYKTFSLGDRESYALNYIAEYELGEEKTSFNQVSLTDLADQDWEKFVKYNIQDVRILIKLENRLKFLKLTKNLANKGFVQPERAMGKVSLITGAVAHQASLDGLIIPTFNVENQKTSFEGGYVKEPVPALYEDIVTYDANSLYPNTIITLNISPETKIAKITSFDNDEYRLLLSNHKTVTLSKEKFDKLIITEELSLSKSNVLYSQKNKGIIPKFIDNLYAQRVDAKNEVSKYSKLKMIETDPNKIKFYEEKISDNNTLSDVYKVVLNSTYGIFSQIYSPLFDIDHAESITLTGQASVKQGAQILYDKFLSDGVECTFDDVCKYSDTDSLFFQFSKSLAHHNTTLLKDDIITNESQRIIEEYGEYLNEHIQKWAISELNSTDPRYFFKREKICDIAVLQKKKFYILHIRDNDGIPCNKFIYKGIEVAKSIMSKDVKKLIKHNIETAIMSRDENASRKLFTKSYDDFCAMNHDQISFRKKVNDYDKGESGYVDNIFAKGTPYHTKAAINYNKMLEKLEIDNRYVKIGNGNKFKFFYTLKNAHNYKSMAFYEEYPPEFMDIIKPDYKLMYQKLVSPVIGRVYAVIGWPTPKVGVEYVTDIMELFS